MSFWACTIFITWHRNIWHWKIVLRLSSSWCAQVNAKQDCSGLPVVPRAKNIIRQISNSRMNFLEMDSCKITLSSEHFGTAKMTSIQKRKKKEKSWHSHIKINFSKNSVKTKNSFKNSYFLHWNFDKKSCLVVFYHDWNELKKSNNSTFRVKISV